eukprot:12182381-Ditylum_brightwellii.AAC.2
MKTAPTTKRNSNPNVKQAIIAFTRPTPRNLERGLPKEWIKFWRRLQAVLKGQNVMQGPASYAFAKTLLKGDALMVFEQAEISHGNQTVPHFELCLDDVAAHMFPEKAGQTQKLYMQRNIQYS